MFYLHWNENFKSHLAQTFFKYIIQNIINILKKISTCVPEVEKIPFYKPHLFLLKLIDTPDYLATSVGKDLPEVAKKKCGLSFAFWSRPPSGSLWSGSLSKDWKPLEEKMSSWWSCNEPSRCCNHSRCSSCDVECDSDSTVSLLGWSLGHEILSSLGRLVGSGCK